MSSGRAFTLLVSAGGARLLRGPGRPLLELADPSIPAEALRAALPPRARARIVLADPGLDVRCREVPYLDARDQADVARRLAQEAGLSGERALAHVLDPDPRAEGGHVLWLASYPRRDLDAWIGLLRAAGARVEAVIPWQRALLAAGPGTRPDALWLALEPATGHLLFTQGRALRFLRSFPVAPREPGDRSAADLRELWLALAEQLALLLPFLRQKHPGAEPRALFGVGVPEAAGPLLDDLGLPYTGLGEDLDAFLQDGAERERARKARLDLLPVELREARKRAGFRALVWSALATMGLLGAGAKAVLEHVERGLEREAMQAEAGLEQRRGLARDNAAAVRLRFGWLRVRQAEARRQRAAEVIEQVGLQLFRTAPGVDLDRVEITQAPGDAVACRFTVAGSAHTGSLFSLGFLAGYYRRLAAQPGVRLAPLKEVVVTDSPAPSGRGRVERAVTRFRIEGSVQ